MVALEVSAHLTTGEVATALGKMPGFLSYFPMYRKHELFGAVAGIRVEKDAVAFASSKGLIAIGPSGESARLRNLRGFRPETWRATGSGRTRRRT